MQIKKFNHLKYNPALDGLRGIAISMVMVFHATPNLLTGGFIGVDIFFVLSGFLITMLLIKEYEAEGQISLRQFYFRRALRLAPALLLLLVVFSCASLIVLSGPRLHQFLTDAIITFAYLSNWARAFNIHPPDFLGHTWSLAIEEQFYLVWPIFLVAMTKWLHARKFWLALALGIAGCAVMWRIYLLVNNATPMRLYNGLDTRADSLMIGSGLAIALSLNSVRTYFAKDRSLILSLLAVIAAATICLFAIYGQWDQSAMFYWGYSLTAIMSAIVIADAVQTNESMLFRVLSYPLLVWLGSISYGLYLWHFPVYRVLLANGVEQINVLWLGSIITLAIAACSFYTMEKYFLQFKYRNRQDS